jgi:hypothetical protein
MDTDSCESDAAKELLPPYPGKHRTTDRDVGPSKRRKYDENYIDSGFTYFGSSAFPQPQCVICAKLLSHNSMKPSPLCRHSETKHAHLKNKPREFERELRRLSSSKTCIKVTDTINKELEDHYMVSYRVARTGKAHTIVEDLILPADADMAGTMLREKAKKTVSCPHVNAFIKQHCSTTHQ